MNKRKRHPIKKERKNNLIGFIVMFLVLTSIAIGSPLRAKAINDGNMFVIFLPLIVTVTLFAAFIILVIILVMRQKLRQKLRENKQRRRW